MFYDVMESISTPFPCTNDGVGFIRLVDVMPRLIPNDKTADYAIVQAARVSYGGGTKQVRDDESLIRYLMRNSHWSPFEMAEMKFHVKLPIFVARQFIRHRTFNVNEISGRYSELPESYWMPDKWREQCSFNKQGSTGHVNVEVDDVEVKSFVEYKKRLAAGISREQARTCLPLSTYTEWYWKADLRNILHFLKLRMDNHAQEEARNYANVMAELVEKVFPITYKAFQDYHVNSVTFSAVELDWLKSGATPIDASKTEVKDFTEKLKKIRK